MVSHDCRNRVGWANVQVIIKERSVLCWHLKAREDPFPINKFISATHHVFPFVLTTSSHLRSTQSDPDHTRTGVWAKKGRTPHHRISFFLPYMQAVVLQPAFLPKMAKTLASYVSSFVRSAARVGGDSMMPSRLAVGDCLIADMTLRPIQH